MVKTDSQGKKRSLDILANKFVFSEKITKHEEKYRTDRDLNSGLSR